MRQRMLGTIGDPRLLYEEAACLQHYWRCDLCWMFLISEMLLLSELGEPLCQGRTSTWCWKWKTRRNREGWPVCFCIASNKSSSYTSFLEGDTHILVWWSCLSRSRWSDVYNCNIWRRSVVCVAGPGVPLPLGHSPLRWNEKLWIKLYRDRYSLLTVSLGLAMDANSPLWSVSLRVGNGDHDRRCRSWK